MQVLPQPLRRTAPDVFRFVLVEHLDKFGVQGVPSPHSRAFLRPILEGASYSGVGRLPMNGSRPWNIVSRIPDTLPDGHRTGEEAEHEISVMVVTDCSTADTACSVEDAGFSHEEAGAGWRGQVVARDWRLPEITWLRRS
ncbi:hypothetical protein SKAU_G00103910 [Synaphobranchus kaupii]|uniref:Uncharacterized protein n=1 Tax=Synaphobranchus kaupii TaxID=118154 RepID=A0A9Q1FZX0_SYNKA|nr:hypothetical protein SKAU_G00103910 [Synaphobranchus kaupii]